MKVIDYSYLNVEILVGKYCSIEQKNIQHLHILPHGEYMENLEKSNIIILMNA